MITEIVLGVFIVIFVLNMYVIWNLFRKTELLETWVEEFTQRIQKIQNDLRDIDSTGHFEADDEIGTIFNQIKETVNQLDNLKGEDANVS